MQYMSLLETTAEVSIALAGFVGIFLALSSRDGKLQAPDVVAIRSIVSCSISPVFYAVIPILLFTFGVGEPELWRVSSGIVIILAVANWWGVLHSLRDLPSGERKPRSRFVSVSGPICGVVALGCHAINFASWPFTASAGIYLLAVWLIILIAAIYFVSMIFNRVL